MKTAKPPIFLLAGDSTTAVQSYEGGGWGPGFLTTLIKGAIGTNYGHNGATTVSFVECGDWEKILNAVDENSDTYSPYVTIQFGHNDQKPWMGISVDQFEENLKKMVEDVRTAGGTTVLVTPLSRRDYDEYTGDIIQNLAPQVEATLRAAQETGSAYIDLNKASIDYLNAIGPIDAHKYNLHPSDTSHLNYQGSLVFGNMVANLIESCVIGRQVRRYLGLDEAIVHAIKNGKFILPDASKAI